MQNYILVDYFTMGKNSCCGFFQAPVLGFNGVMYDRNLIKQYLLEHILTYEWY